MFLNSKEVQKVPKLVKALTGQFLSVPGLVMDETFVAEYKTWFKSREENANVAGLNAAALKLVYDGFSVRTTARPGTRQLLLSRQVKSQSTGSRRTWIKV